MNDLTTFPYHAVGPDGHPQGGQAHGLAAEPTHSVQGGSAGRSNASSHHGRDKIDWGPEVWVRIDAAVREEIKRSRVAARFLPTVHVPAKSTTVPADAVSVTANAGGGAGATPAGVAPSAVFSVDETSTTRVNEIWVEFSLTPAQVEEEEAAVHGMPHGQHPQQQQQSQLHSHGHQHHQMHASTAMSLATRAANILAQVEDSIIFQGKPVSGRLRRARRAAAKTRVADSRRILALGQVGLGPLARFGRALRRLRKGAQIESRAKKADRSQL